MDLAATKNSWLVRRVESALRGGLTRAYETIKVDPERFLFHLRVAHELPVETYEGLFTLPVERLDEVALQTVRAGMKLAGRRGSRLWLRRR